MVTIGGNWKFGKIGTEIGNNTSLEPPSLKCDQLVVYTLFTSCIFIQNEFGGDINDCHITYSPTVPEPPPGGLTPWIEIYKYQRRYTVHRFCAKQMKAFSGLRENVTMVIAIYNLSCQGHKKYILIFFINLPQKKEFVVWKPLVKQSVWSAHGRFWLVVFVEVRARRFLGNEARFLVDT